ncbi:hypothetical protein [Arabiibacter massiliensis]|uniref:hypothetical protein n=1 Tax=Arabiibacter massiliensis TaxID=1870985 RepID=UPI0009BBC2B5|nr:hypothetical protein [Arabiibacter massiliensis]
MMELVVPFALGLAIFAFGALVFAGNERCYRILAGGESFLALDPGEAELRRSARLSGAAVCLVAVALWCAVARAYAPVGEGFGAALVAVAVGAGAGVVVLIVLQLRQYARLLRRSDRG